jgi:hypothetical protein
MKPITFPEVNTIYAKDQKEYSPLPAFLENSIQGEVITCWKLSFIERLRILFTGRIWLALLSFNKPLTPTFITTRKSEVLETTEEKDRGIKIIK